MKDELKPWREKVDQARKQTEVLRIYFNNRYGDNAVVNALQLSSTGFTFFNILRIKLP
jgi:uncharacterized protein YecE (DUF72 family)